MTEPLSIKDLNCYNCSRASLARGKNWLHSGVSCEGKDVLPDGVATIEQKGCASHPLALQVLAQPIVEELERLMEEARKEHNGAMSYGLRLDRRGKVDAMELAIKLLKGDNP